MKIAEIVSTFPPYHGGMGYVCLHYTSALARRGHDVTVFTLDYDRRRSYEEECKNFKIDRLKTPLLYGYGGVIPQLVSRLKHFDILHLHYPFYGAAEYVYAASLLWGKRYFLTYHIDVHANTFLKKLILSAYEPLLTPKIVRRAAGISAPGGEYLKQSQIAPFIVWDKVFDIQHAGVDIDTFRPRAKDKKLMEMYALEGKTVALFVGNLLSFKGVHLLIDAIADIPDEKLVLLIVGGGYKERDYRQQARQRGVTHRIIFAGPCSPAKELPACYNLADFLVLPSTHSESFGLVVLEAMASGKPAIVSALPGPAQLIENGTDGLTFDVGARTDLQRKIEYLAYHPEQREMMGNAARKKVEKSYTWDSIGEQLERIFTTIVKR